MLIVIFVSDKVIRNMLVRNFGFRWFPNTYLSGYLVSWFWVLARALPNLAEKFFTFLA